MALLQQAGAEAGRGTLLLFGHAICFFPHMGSSQTQLLFLLLLPAPSPTCTHGWPQLD